MSEPITQPDQTQFATHLDLALHQGNISLSWLSQYLRLVGTPVTPAALSYWRTGRSRPKGRSIQAVANIEHVLDLPSGSLLGHLGHQVAERSMHRGLHTSRDLLRAMTTLGTDHLSSLRDIRIDGAWITWHRGDPTQSSRLDHVFAGQVVRGPITRIPIFAWGDPEPGPMVTGLEGLFAAQLDEPIADEQERLMVAHILLDRPVQEGESVVFGYSATYAGSSARTESLERRLLYPADCVVFELQFEVPPAGQVRKFFVDDLGRHSIDEPVPMGDGSMTAAFVNAPIGQAGMHWTR